MPEPSQFVIQLAALLRQPAAHPSEQRARTVALMLAAKASMRQHSTDELAGIMAHVDALEHSEKVRAMHGTEVG